MTAEQFVYWLQGFMEVTDPVSIDSKQTQQIKDHLALVLTKKTPIRTNTPSESTDVTRFPTSPTPNVLPDIDWTYRPNITYTVDPSDLTRKIC